jgi:hypothetical protein
MLPHDAQPFFSGGGDREALPPSSTPHMPDIFRSRNQLALTALVTGKLLGIGGLVLGASVHRTLGGLFLCIEGLCIVIATVFCVRNMRGRTKEEAGHKQVLAQMMREGTLKQYLRDLQAEGRVNDVRDDTPAFS